MKSDVTNQHLAGSSQKTPDNGLYDVPNHTMYMDSKNPIQDFGIEMDLIAKPGLPHGLAGDTKIEIPPLDGGSSKPNKSKKAGSGSAVVNSMMPVGFEEMDDDLDEISEMDMSLTEDDANPLEEKNFMGFAQQTIVGVVAKNRHTAYRIFIGLFLCGFTVYMGFAIAYSVEGALAPMVFTGLVLFFWSYNQIVKHWGTEIYENFLYPMQCWVNGNWYWMKW